MLDETTYTILLMTGGMVAVVLAVLALTAATLLEAQRRSWGRDRWSEFEREALREALGVTGRHRGLTPFTRRAA
ncbi:hypothetical protein DLJ49_03810 [Rhodovulum sp. 12E13]|uniref:hypothetical protein n=1 Tax=Rhodovulum sp. 12E13 TaxID=2203891 RepID=UPI000E172661|nr:hypothetical protein [Rhodovulum sp. 12E13]RDC74425.1 hypothetical protein DLJ49_03810 [Rhodovulum sp. 12E13]